MNKYLKRYLESSSINILGYKKSKVIYCPAYGDSFDVLNGSNTLKIEKTLNNIMTIRINIQFTYK